METYFLLLNPKGKCWEPLMLIYFISGWWIFCMQQSADIIPAKWRNQCQMFTVYSMWPCWILHWCWVCSVNFKCSHRAGGCEFQVHNQRISRASKGLHFGWWTRFSDSSWRHPWHHYWMVFWFPYVIDTKHFERDGKNSAFLLNLPYFKGSYVHW